MGAYRIKPCGAGVFCVLADEDEQVFGPARHAECKAWVLTQTGGAQSAPPAAVDEPAGEREPTPAELRAWDAKVAAVDRATLLAELPELKEMLLKRRSRDEVDYLLREDGEIMRALKAGLEGGRRERIRYLRKAA